MQKHVNLRSPTKAIYKILGVEDLEKKIKNK